MPEAESTRVKDKAEPGSDGESGGDFPPAWRHKGFRLSVLALAFIVAAGLSFGAGRAFGLGNTAIHSAIPVPLKGDDIFVEDSEGIAQDNMSNITAGSGQGMVHILSDGAPVGIGLVLTQSGKVLTTYLPAADAPDLSAKYVYSGQAYQATVIGTNPTAHLALLQLQGANGRAFSTVTVGNSALAVKSGQVIRQSSYHVPGDIVDTAVSTTGTSNGVSLDVGRLTTLNTKATLGRLDWTGLMASAMASEQPPANGAPLVNPNGHVIGIIIGSSGTGADSVSYAIPINGALADAALLDGDG